MNDLDATKNIMGMEILRVRSQKKLFLSHKRFIQKVLPMFGMSCTKPINTPSVANLHLTMYVPQFEERKEYMSQVLYASIVEV